MIEASHAQLYVQDLPAYSAWMRAGAATDPELPAAGWTDRALHLHRIGVECHSIAVGTARINLVESVITVRFQRRRWIRRLSTSSRPTSTFPEAS